MSYQIIDAIVNWISVVPPAVIFLIFFGIAYIENVLPFLPGDVIIAFGGYLAADGIIAIFPLWVITVIGSAVGFMNMYWLGMKWHNQIENNKDSHFVLRFIPYRYFVKGRKWMGRWGQLLILGNRFIAGTRTVVSLTAGISHLNIRYTLLNSTISSMLWNAILIGFGWVVRDNWEIIVEYLSAYGKVILICTILLVLGRIIWVYFKNSEARLKKEKS